MNKHPFIVLGILMVFSLSTACLWIHAKPVHFGEVKPTRTPTANCPPLPENFKEADLFGTWVAEYWVDATDSLVLRDDGKYKQIYDDPTGNFHYESDWQTWWVEYREVGYLWLHMNGMRRCDDLPEVCEKVEGGTERRTIDSCEYIDVREQDEVILVVTGVDFETPRSIVLRQTRLAGNEWSYSFKLLEEKENP
ncbi:MAG: hypothetical protein WAV05_10830 [Anaerolineales bacterium]